LLSGAPAHGCTVGTLPSIRRGEMGCASLPFTIAYSTVGPVVPLFWFDLAVGGFGRGVFQRSDHPGDGVPDEAQRDDGDDGELDVVKPFHVALGYLIVRPASRHLCILLRSRIRGETVHAPARIVGLLRAVKDFLIEAIRPLPFQAVARTRGR